MKRSAGPEHPSRKHDSPAAQSAEVVDQAHAQPVMVRFGADKALALLPRRRDRRTWQRAQKAAGDTNLKGMG